MCSKEVSEENLCGMQDNRLLARFSVVSEAKIEHKQIRILINDILGRQDDSDSK